MINTIEVLSTKIVGIWVFSWFNSLEKSTVQLHIATCPIMLDEIETKFYSTSSSSTETCAVICISIRTDVEANVITIWLFVSVGVTL